MNLEKARVKFFTLKIACYSSVSLNSICIVLGMIYIGLPSYSFIWDLFGVILSITLFTNLFLAYINSNNNNKLKKRSNLVSYGYLVFTILAILGMMVGNLLLSVTYSNRIVDNLEAYVMIYFFYFGVLVFSLYLAIIDIKNLKNANHKLQGNNFKKRCLQRFIRVRKALKKTIIIFCRITFIIGILFAFVIIFGSVEIITTLIAIISAQFGIFFSIIFLANTVLLLKLKNHKRNSKKYYRTAIFGVIISGVLLAPLILTQVNVYNAERAFSSAFGNDWRDKIPAEVNEYFLETPFSIPSYFLGKTPKDCRIEKDVLFYDNEGIKLYFDAYMPSNGGKGLPGENSVLIRIHGGGWVSGDKGMMNMMQMNKYFAAQGYVVFDIQYGIDDNPLFETDPLTPDYKKGNFNIDDMMRHIGVFTHYLANHSDEYGANLDSVFVSGGSAGGHLACAVALAMSSGNYTDFFSQRATIKGLIPFYPANGQIIFFGIDGRDEFKNPEKLIENDSPPCLIFQGTHDILNYFSISTDIRDTYWAKGNNECAIIWMQLGGHASDFYFSGYYNQVFLYYMERFLYLYH